MGTCPVVSRGPFEEVIEEQSDIFPTISQGGSFDEQMGQTIVEVLPKEMARNGLLEQSCLVRARIGKRSLDVSVQLVFDQMGRYGGTIDLDEGTIPPRTPTLRLMITLREKRSYWVYPNDRAPSVPPRVTKNSPSPPTG